MRRSGRPSSGFRRATDIVLAVLTLFLAWYLWPAALGGSSRLVMVHGKSMEPTYKQGELVLLDSSAANEIGTVIVFAIPADEPGAGQLVVHRIVGTRADGTFITQGDNKDTPDDFHVKPSDILGSPRLAVPYVGNVLAVIRTPAAVGVASGVLFVLYAWPRKGDKAKEAKPEASDSSLPAAAVAEPTVDPTLTDDTDRAWPSLNIPPDVAAEAEAWLESQLSSVK